MTGINYPDLELANEFWNQVRVRGPATDHYSCIAWFGCYVMKFRRRKLIHVTIACYSKLTGWTAINNAMILRTNTGIISVGLNPLVHSLVVMCRSVRFFWAVLRRQRVNSCHATWRHCWRCVHPCWMSHKVISLHSTQYSTHQSLAGILPLLFELLLFPCSCLHQIFMLPGVPCFIIYKSWNIEQFSKFFHLCSQQ